MNTKKFAGLAAAGAVSAVTTLMLGATPALAQESENDYAFALEASGALDISPLSQVESANGNLVSDELLSIGDVAGEYEDDISVGVLTAEAEANRAESAVKELNLLNILRADAIRTWCDNGEGGVEIVNGSVLGQDLPDTAVPGEELDLSPLVKLTLNDQVRNSDGSLTVTGIKLEVLPSAEGNSDEALSSEEKAALPVVGELLGQPLGGGVNTVRDLVGQLGGGLGLEGGLQTITIGEANCHEGGAEGVSNDGDENGNDDGNGDGDGSNGDDNGDGDGSNDDGDDNGNGNGDDNGNGDGSNSDGDVKSAPAPSVVKAALPVTG